MNEKVTDYGAHLAESSGLVLIWGSEVLPTTSEREGEHLQ